MNNIKVINQYTPSVAFGDSISNAVIYIQKILKSLGFKSKIYIGLTSVDINFRHEVYHISQYEQSENNMLLFHHSIGHEDHDYILNFLDKKVMIYHNITPAHYFPKDSFLSQACIQGRKQLKSHPEKFLASIGDSKYNCKELIINNYENVKELPLLIDFDKHQTPSFNQEIINKYDNTFNILFVGRIVLNKCQHQLINVMKYLKDNYQTKDFRLIIVGGASQVDYLNYIKNYTKNLELDDKVIFAGKVSDDDLATYYKISNLYLSLSNHEGFGMPLIEALKYDVPVLAYDVGGIPSTVNKNSLLKNKSTSYIAKRVIQISQDSFLRSKIIKEQQKLLENFSNKNIKNRFIDFLFTLGIDKLSFKDSTEKSTELNIQIQGPFDSTYSLSIVNKNLAKSLNKSYNVSLYSTEGHGDFTPNEKNLDTQTLKMYKNNLEHIDLTIRNLYPPRTNILKGHCKVLGPYGWEESAFDTNYINQFNRNLSFLMCMSNYVRKVMIDNGLKIPTPVTHIGVDHVLQADIKPLEKYQIPTNSFILLHISSCFPRKGADILLEVFDKLVAQHKDMFLIIKTFDNPHNNIKEQIQNLSTLAKERILLITDELPQEEINYLYTISNALVAPSKGEGFGLPMAEAMLFDTPVITTAFGGQTDFCTDETSWLIDYTFEKANTHMKLFNSYWANPKKESLEKQILSVYNSDEETIKQKITKAKKNITENFTWDNISKNVMNSYTNFLNTPPKDSNMNIAWISTFNSKCGIASYSKSLIDTITKTSNNEVQIFANNLEQKDLISNNVEKEYKIIRNWKDRFQQNNAQLIQDLNKTPFSHIIIQFNFAFFSTQNLKEIIEANSSKNIILELHSTEDVKVKGIEASLGDISNTLQKVKNIIVHNIQDLNILKNFGLINNVSLIPLGVESKPQLKTTAYDYLFIDDKFTISTFGFLLPHKGILELIQSFSKVIEQKSNTQLILLNSLYPSPISTEYKKSCEDEIKALKLENNITFITDYLPQNEALSILSKSDLLVLAYKDNQESASASVRNLISTHKPILCTKQNIFNDIYDIVHTTKNNTTDGLSHSILDLINNPTKLHSNKNIQERWINEHSWENIVKKYLNIIKE